MVQMDCIDMRNYADQNEGFGWILNILDSYSKYLYSFPMKNKSAISVNNCLKQVICNEGSPILIQTDNGKEFVNELMRSFLNEKNIRHVRGRPRHPRNQG